jgi:hypothetical protein
MLLGEVNGKTRNGSTVSLISGYTLLREGHEGKGHTATVIVEKYIYSFV